MTAHCFTKALGSAYWASYLINGDASGIDERNERLADNWLASHNAFEAVDCADESEFSWRYGDETGDETCTGGDLLEYTLRLK